jgi:hypothetical protein
MLSLFAMQGGGSRANRLQFDNFKLFERSSSPATRIQLGQGAIFWPGHLTGAKRRGAYWLKRRIAVTRLRPGLGKGSFGNICSPLQQSHK